jgi:predicted  nucleic acid-binding Zn-ribbon protein
MENLGEKKSFWKRPEGVTGVLFLGALILGAGYLLYNLIPALIPLLGNVLVLAATLLVVGVIVYMVLDPKMRTLVSYMYKSIMRSITSLFVTIDPIGILKNYVDDLQDNLGKMSKQIGNIRGQMRKLKTQVEENSKEIENNLMLAKKAREKGMEQEMILSSRKAARLKDTNQKYSKLLGKMEILYRVLAKMYKNSEILLEDTRDQVKLKEQERKAIRASHGAMKSAMNVISGNTDKRVMFDQALEVIADDVANKVGEMERFMELSSSIMDKVDLQSGAFEEEGMRMLDEWEKNSTLMLMSGTDAKDDFFDLDAEIPQRTEDRSSDKKEGYDKLFE